MSRNKKNTSRRRANLPTPRNHPIGAPSNSAADDAAEVQMFLDLASTQDPKILTAAKAEELPPPVWSEDDPEGSLLRAFDVMDQRRKFYEDAATAADARTRSAKQLQERLAERALTIDADQEAAAQARSDAEELRAQAAEKIAELREREERVRVLEEDAETGFRSAAQAARVKLDKELSERRTKFDQELDLERSKSVERLEEHEELITEQLNSMRTEVERARARLADEQTALQKQREEIRLDRGTVLGREIAVSRRESEQEAEVEALAAVAVADAQRETHLTAIRAEAAEQLTADLGQRLTELEKALFKLGTTDPARLLDELESLRTANSELQNQIAARLNDDDLARLRSAEERNRELSNERERLSLELQQLKGNVLANSINNLKVRQLEDAEHHYEVMSRGYHSRIAELHRTIETIYKDRPDPRSPLFPQCVSMDDNAMLNDPGVVLDDAIDLSSFTRNLQSTMFRESERAYRVNDIAVFLGGLAMARLHLLEGMSGIGKTSLPKAFAAALHTDCAIVEVQAGWRDRTDLFGHHNTFEHRFEESDFLQALYRAGTPRYRDRPFFIVLDEMNLSRPEQYFSVLLSKLENDDGKAMQLVSSSAGRPPALFENGIGLRLPDNVWFIGTANQDESTLEFADKTYNRAHLMELPSHRPWVPQQNSGSVQPYSSDALYKAFSKAQEVHKDAVKKVRQLVDDLSGDLWEQGRVQMSPRVEEQLRKFVPVVVAAWQGQHLSEHYDYGDADQDGLALAADHFLAYKVLRAIRGRYDVTPERIEALQESVLLHWEANGMAGLPTRSTRVFDEERRRRAG
ncbi:AAA family ATPase [Lentzea californiensis]|uniref:AAA family ATPase n=1 Tax=Lentzea californiensis TaxID=438851 RepID=UPI002165EDC2|nr:AAA family ATPase [Lentzea californiensis]